MNYDKQYSDLRTKFDKKEILAHELIDLIIEARKQRDEFKTQRDNFKKGNRSIADRICKVGDYLEKAEKLCKLH
jgi:hypothetical protein